MIELGDDKQNWSADEISVTDTGIIKRAIGAAAIGNITEWYDFGVYAYFETTIKDVFFSGLDDPWATIVTFGTFAVAFLVRPFGGMFFGPLADRIGRNKVLATTMIMMALGTFCIGIIPSPQTLGLAAPLLLLTCRLIQGFSTGGEYGNAMTFIAEYAPDRKRGFLGSWLEFGTFTGYLMGAIIVTVMTAQLSEDQLLSWGWRIPFFVALPLGLVGVYLRSKLADTPAYQAMEKEADEREKQSKKRDDETALQHLKAIITRYWPSMLVCMGLVLAWNIPNYMLTSYMPTFITEDVPKHSSTSAISTDTSNILQIIVMAILLISIPLLGRLSDKVGRKPIAWAGAVGLLVTSLPSILLIRSGQALPVFFGLLLMGLCLICFSSTMPSTLPTLFPTKERSSGLSVAFNVSISLFCGTVSTVMGALVGLTDDLNWPAYYLIATGIIGALCVFLTPEPKGRPMWGSAPAAESEQEARELATTS